MLQRALRSGLGMQVSKRSGKAADASDRRAFDRHNVSCRARIVIGTRHYAGYLHNISRGGAKLRTITPIGRIGTVLLKLPDLPPIRCRLQWSDCYNAGVAFELLLRSDIIADWLRGRCGRATECDIGLEDAA
jgi:hypothetical protein